MLNFWHKWGSECISHDLRWRFYVIDSLRAALDETCKFQTPFCEQRSRLSGEFWKLKLQNWAKGWQKRVNHFHTKKCGSWTASPNMTIGRDNNCCCTQNAHRMEAIGGAIQCCSQNGVGNFAGLLSDIFILLSYIFSKFIYHLDSHIPPPKGPCIKDVRTEGGRGVWELPDFADK